MLPLLILSDLKAYVFSMEWFRGSMFFGLRELEVRVQTLKSKLNTLITLIPLRTPRTPILGLLQV